MSKLVWKNIDGGQSPSNYSCQSGLTFTETERADVDDGYLLKFTIKESFYDENMKCMGWRITSQQITHVKNK